MSRIASENTGFGLFSCLRNYCLKMALGAFFGTAIGCVTEDPELRQLGAPNPIVGMPVMAPAPQALPSDVKADAKPVDVRSSKAEGVLAEPISPATVARYPHLKAFQGHVLLSGATVQVVLAGVPPEPSTDDWQPGVVAFAERRGAQWHIMTGIGRIEVSGHAPSGPVYRAIGVNAGVDRLKNLAYASFVYATAAAKSPRQIVTFRLDGSSGRLSILPEPAAAAGPLPKGLKPLVVLWQLRFRAVGALNLAARDDLVGPFHGIPYLIRYQGADILGVVGFRPFDLDDQLAQLTLTPELGLSGPLIEGWQLLIGRDAALNTLSAAGTIKACMYDRGRTAAKLVPGCSADSLFGRLTLALPERDAGRQEIAQPVFVYDAAGNPILYTALFAGETVVAELPRAPNYRLADTRSGRALKDIASFAIASADGYKTELSARGAGRVVIDPGQDRSPAMITVNRLDQPKGLPVAPGLVEPSRHVTQLSANSFLVHDWPVEWPLLAGTYVVELARGSDGVFCNVRAQIVENQVRKLLCPAATFKTEISDDAGFIAGDLTAPLDQAEGTIGETLKKVYGVTFLPPSLTVEDPESGLQLRFVPGSPNLEGRWRASRGKSKGALLQAFAKFIRAQPEATNGVLELGCPAPGITLAEYERTAGRLNPDAVRLFGCATGLEQNEQLAVAGRLVRRKKSPLAITPVSPLAHAVSGIFFPRLFVAAADLGKTPDLGGFLTRVKAAEAVATAGAVVRLADIKPRAGVRGDYTASVELSSSPEVRPRYIVVYTEQGVVKREPIADAERSLRTLTINLTVPSDAQWLRVEVRGSSRRSSVSQLFDRNYGIALATTGFRPFKPSVSH